MALHDDIRAWLKLRVADPAALHSRLVDAWDWRRLPNDYAWQRLIWHLAQANRREDLTRTLLDPLWITAKLDATDVNSLIADYEYAKPSAEAERMQGALRLSGHVLAKDKGQLRSQLAGRIGQSDPPLGRVVQGIPITRMTLVPRTPTLTPPGTALLRTLAGHTAWGHERGGDGGREAGGVRVR